MSQDPIKAWSEIVLGPEYDQHMAAVGQAKANAGLLREFLSDSRDLGIEKVLMVGAGTGQFLDFIDASCLQGLDWTFTDISPSFLELLKGRANQKRLSSFRTVVDNIEATSLRGAFDLGIVILVLEHVEWKRALQNLRDLPCQRVLIVIQENPEEMTTNVSPTRVLPPSLVEASKIAGGHLIQAADLEAVMSGLSYLIESDVRKKVPDAKHMRRLVYRLNR